MKFDIDYAKKVIASEGKAVSSMAGLVGPQFVAAAEMIYNCQGSVIVSGIGKAGIIGQKISATMASTGTPSHFLHPAEAIHGDLGKLRKKDILLILSYGGETDEVIRLINMVKQLEVKMIAITGDDESRLAEHSDVVLCMGKLDEACPLGVAPSVSTTCMLAVGDALALMVMKARKFSVEDYARFHPGGSLGARLITVEQSMMFKSNEKLPLANVDDTIGEMIEKSKLVKRHGAVMTVDAQGRLAGILTDADLRRLFSEKLGDAFSCKVADVMTSGCKRINKSALASEAMAIFHKHRIDDLPVVDDDDRPIGMIDVQDIVAIKIVG
ncbi:MAG: KpsF/GutQ family sugar-phosphate isomerase [Anaerohalosphaeraceae bacterium]|nr:KpsF/GutQ family sugar-phosphate isomerase [Anaerohalosphaeraceae bacterium]